MTALTIGDWAFKWIWANNGVGNFAAGVVVAVLASAFWPPVRKRIHKSLDAKLALVHAHLDQIHAHIASATGVPKPEEKKSNDQNSH